jgi:hypothetical protein
MSSSTEIRSRVIDRGELVSVRFCVGGNTLFVEAQAVEGFGFGEEVGVMR